MTVARAMSFAVVAVLAVVPASAQLTPPPPEPGATTRAMPYLLTAGASDVYEVTSSQIALKRSQNPETRRFASMLIDHHTRTSNAALGAAKADGVVPPPPVLNARFRAMIAELNTTPAARFDRVYFGQQVPAHRAALMLQQAYGQRGEGAALRSAAQTAVPIIQRHLDEASAMARR